MAGRAGRRGIDAVGNVIHLNNMMWGGKYPDTSTYKDIVGGAPQKLTSKFSINFDIILNMVEMGLEYADLENYSSKSMLRGELDSMIRGINTDITGLREMIGNHGMLQEDMDAMEHYTQLEKSMLGMNGNKRKKVFKLLAAIEAEDPGFKAKKKKFDACADTITDVASCERSRDNIMGYFGGTIQVKLEYLVTKGYIEIDADTGRHAVTRMGRVALLVREAPGLAMGRMLDDPAFAAMSPVEITGFVSCFANIRVSDDIRAGPPAYSGDVSSTLSTAIGRLGEIMADNVAGQLSAGIHDLIEDPDTDLCYDIVEETIQWCSCEDEAACRILMGKLKEEKGVTPGEFVKAVLKIVNVVLELQNACEVLAQVEMGHKLSQIPVKILKYIATTQSLYV